MHDPQNGARPDCHCAFHVAREIAPMSGPGLGCAKTPAVAPHVEISPRNCVPESQIILHTRGSMPCWRIVFSTFCGCMSFYTGSVRVGHSAMSAQCPNDPQERS